MHTVVGPRLVSVSPARKRKGRTAGGKSLTKEGKNSLLWICDRCANVPCGDLSVCV